MILLLNKVQTVFERPRPWRHRQKIAQKCR